MEMEMKIVFAPKTWPERAKGLIGMKKPKDDECVLYEYDTPQSGMFNTQQVGYEVTIATFDEDGEMTASKLCSEENGYGFVCPFNTKYVIEANESLMGEIEGKEVTIEVKGKKATLSIGKKVEEKADKKTKGKKKK